MYNTEQEVFDAVVIGLAGQGFQKSVNDGGMLCSYRGQGDNRCAAGHLIPDEIYRPEFEGKEIRRLFEHVPEISALFGPDVRIQFVSTLQRMHDSGSDLEAEFKAFATENGLIYPL